MKMNNVIALIVAGSILVVLPVILGLFTHEQVAFTENYQKAMERQLKTTPNTTEQNPHYEALHQAKDLKPSDTPAYLSQGVGSLMILVGVVKMRSRPGVGPPKEAVPSTGSSS